MDVYRITEKPTANKANFQEIFYFLIYIHSRPNLNETHLQKENRTITRAECGGTHRTISLDENALGILYF